MNFRIDQKYIVELRFLVLPICIVILLACATVPTKTYEETVSQWKSYEDAAKWMKRHFSYDLGRLKEVRGKPAMPRSPEETFRLKSGLCYDAAYFLKDVLDRIDPSYEARVVFVEVSPFPAVLHDFVCSFKKEGKLFIMHYGTLVNNLVGVHGPYDSLDEFKQFYERNHPKSPRVLSVRYR
jgi:hypothetical protein